jgi:hypothetical protein
VCLAHGWQSNEPIGAVWLSRQVRGFPELQKKWSTMLKKDAAAAKKGKPVARNSVELPILACMWIRAAMSLLAAAHAASTFLPALIDDFFAVLETIPAANGKVNSKRECVSGDAPEREEI